MATTTRRMSFFHLIPMVLAIVSVGFTAWGNQAPGAKKADDKKPAAKASAKSTAPAKNEVPAKSEAAKTKAPAKTESKPAAKAGDAKPAEKPAPAKTETKTTAASAPEPKAPAPKAAEPKAPEPKPAAAAPAKLSAANAALAKQIREAKKSFAAGDAGRQQKARSDLQAALKKLDTRLSADGQNGADWKTFLLFDELKAELNKKSNVDLAVLARVGRRYSAGYLGLEDDDYQNVAAALEDFTDATAVAQTKDLKQDYEQTLDELATTLEAADSAGLDSAQAGTIGRLVNHLQRFGQAGDVVKSVTQRYSQPNFLVDLSQNFTDDVLVRPIDRTEPVTDCIMGTAISGCGRTIGDVRLDFAESPDRAVINALMSGVNHSKTVGHNRSALIYSTGQTALSSQQTLFLTEDGLVAGPVRASAKVNNRITGFGSTKGGIVGKIVAKIAAKKAPQQQGQATAIAQQHAKQRLVNSLDKEIKELVTKSQREWQNKVRLPMRRFDVEPQEMVFSTTEDSLRLRILQEGGGRLAATSAPPKIAGNAGLGIRLHASLIENASQQAVAGRTFDRDRIDDLLRNQLGLKLKERNELDEVPFSITFAEQDPISLVFDDDRFSVTVRAAGFTSDGKPLEAMHITTHYTLSVDKSGLKLTRDGDFEIYPPGFVRGGVKKLSLQQTSLRTLLKKKFDKALPIEITPEGVELEDGRGTLIVGHVKAHDGWLSLGLETKKEPKSAE